MARFERHAIMEDYSTLEILDFTYGPNSSASWLTLHIANLNKFAGTKNLSDPQTKELAQIVAQEYKGMKFSVFMLFFYRFKLGDFGKFYGKIDPMVITCSLKDFIASCKEKMFQYQEEEFLARQQEESRLRDEVSFKWFEFHQDLCQRSQSEEQRKAFESIYLYHVDIAKRSLLLAVTKEVSDQIASKYLDFLAPLWRETFPDFSLDYRLVDSKPASTPPLPANPSNFGGKAVFFHPTKEEKAVKSLAQSILSLQEKLGSTETKNLSSQFLALYGSLPEEYGKALKADNNPQKKIVNCTSL